MSFSIDPQRFNPFHVSYHDPKTNLYSQGPADVQFVAIWVFIFTILREFLMRCVWAPIARGLGTRKPRRVLRFAEQGWSFAYYMVFWSLGFYIMQTSPYASLNTEHFFIGYPHHPLPYLTKWYYLVQIGFWIQQLIVLYMEEKRKDFSQMLTHHFVTLALTILSYLCNFTRIGNTVFVLMDFADILLPIAKMANYVKWSKTTDTCFVLFMFAWLYTRHYCYIIVLKSLMYESPRIIGFAWKPEEGHFFNKVMYRTFVGLLMLLQVLLVGWAVQIARVAYFVTVGKGAEDTRSDDEDSEELEDETEPKKPARAGPKKATHNSKKNR